MLFSSKSFPLAICLVGGEVIGFSLGRYSALWPYLASVFCCVLMWLWGSGKRNLFFYFMFFLGISLGGRSESCFRNTLDKMAGLYGVGHEAVITVCDKPKVYTRKNGESLARFKGSVGSVMLYVNAPIAGSNAFPQVGDVWRAKGYMFLKGYKRNKVQPYWVADKGKFEKIGERKRARFYEKVSEAASKYIETGIGWCPEIRDLNKAILLGRRSEMSKSARETFANAGTIHVFAISGLHVMVILQVFIWALKRMGISGFKRNLIVIPMMIMYVFMTGSRPSALRALVMASIVLLAPLFRRESNYLSSWSISAILVYLFSPEKVFDIGCTFSFAVMFGIVLMIDAGRRIRRANMFAGIKKRLMDWKDGGKGFFKRWWEMATSSFFISFSAWVMALPISVSYFGKVSLGGLFASMIIVLLAQYVVYLGVCGLCLCVICEIAGAICNNCSAAFTFFMVKISEWTNLIPFSSIEIKWWNPYFSIAWYVAWFAIYKTILDKKIASITGTGKWW